YAFTFAPLPTVWPEKFLWNHESACDLLYDKSVVLLIVKSRGELFKSNLTNRPTLNKVSITRLDVARRLCRRVYTKHSAVASVKAKEAKIRRLQFVAQRDQ